MKPLSSLRLLLLFLLLASIPLCAQRADTRLSGEPLAAILPEDAKIQSVAAIGTRTLAVWGTSRLTPDSLVVNTLVMQMLDDSTLLGAQKRLVSERARPAGFVQVVPLADRFLVVWNDRRNADSLTYMRVVDLDGLAVGEELPFGGALVSGFGVAATRTSQGYLLFWNNITGSTTRIFSATLDTSGRLLAIDSSSRFAGTLGGGPDIYDYKGRLILDRGALAPLVVDSNGIVTLGSGPFVRDTLRPWYLDRDGSVITTGDDSVRFFRSVFDSVSYRSIGLPRVDRISPFLPTRDSLGELRLIWFGHEQAGRDQFYKYRLILKGNGITLTQGDTFGSSTILYAFEAFTYAQGNRDASFYLRRLSSSFTRGRGNMYRVDFEVHLDVSSNGSTTNHNSHLWFTVDSYGIVFDGRERTIFPALPWTFPGIDRTADFDSSIVKVYASGQWIRLASEAAIVPMFSPQTRPGLSVLGDDLMAVWLSPLSGPSSTSWSSSSYTTVRWKYPDGNGVEQVSMIDSSYLNPFSRHVASYYSAQSLVQSGDRSLISSIHHWRDSSHVHHAAHAVFEPDTSGWRRVVWIETINFVPGQMYAYPYKFDPNTGRRQSVLVAEYANPNRLMATVSAYDGDWSTAWQLDSVIALGRGGEHYFIPIAESEFLHFTDSHAGHRKGRELLRQFDVLPAVADRFFERLLGPYFLQVSRNASEKFAAIQVYGIDGTLVGEHRMEGIQTRDIAVVQNRSDSSIVIVAASGLGVDLTLLDSRLNVRASKIRLSETRDSTARPTAIIRNDTLVAVWEDYRNGSSDVYGTFIPLGTLVGVESPVTGTSRKRRLSIESIQPNPARDNMHIRFALPLDRPGRIELFDLYGNLRLHGVGATGASGVELDCSGLQEGMYTVVVRSGSEVTSGRVVVVR